MRSFVQAAVPRALIAAVVSLAALSCTPGGHRIMAARMGAVYGPKGPACALRFENLNHQEAYAKYEMLGLLTVYDVESSDITPAIKKDVEREGCKMGGDAVTLNASVPGAVQFSVWRAK